MVTLFFCQTHPEHFGFLIIYLKVKSHLKPSRTFDCSKKWALSVTSINVESSANWFSLCSTSRHKTFYVFISPNEVGKYLGRYYK